MLDDDDEYVVWRRIWRKLDLAGFNLSGDMKRRLGEDLETWEKRIDAFLAKGRVHK